MRNGQAVSVEQAVECALKVTDAPTSPRPGIADAENRCSRLPFRGRFKLNWRTASSHRGLGLELP
jgi:hypothetical protein